MQLKLFKEFWKLKAIKPNFLFYCVSSLRACKLIAVRKYLSKANKTLAFLGDVTDKWNLWRHVYKVHKWVKPSKV